MNFLTMSRMLTTVLLVYLILEGHATRKHLREDQKNKDLEPEKTVKQRSDDAKGNVGIIGKLTGKLAPDKVFSKGTVEKIKRKVFKTGVGAGVGHVLLPGAVETLSSAAALDKATALYALAQSMAGSKENHDREIRTVYQAIMFAKGKKAHKAARKMVVGGAKLGTAATLTLTGAGAGSVIPVAGTAAGAYAGYVTTAAIVSPVINAADGLLKISNWARKKIIGTQGLHRAESAYILFASAFGQPGTKDKGAALKALLIILRETEYEWMMDDKLPSGRKAPLIIDDRDHTPNAKRQPGGVFFREWLNRIEDRLKSSS